MLASTQVESVLQWPGMRSEYAWLAPHEGFSSEMSEMSLYWLTFDGIRAASSVSTPTLFIHGDGCALPANARRVHDELRGSKKLHWMQGSQIDFYDQPPLVTAAAEAAVEHFQNPLW